MEQLQYIKIPEYITESGKATPVVLSYQTFGKSLYEAPIVLVNHALTGNSNVIGESGWWNDLIGKGKCIDTDKFSILAFNVPGNGFDGNKDYLIENYKDVTAKDIARLFSIGLERLKINSLFAVIGGSVGGGIAWELAALKPRFIKNLVPIAADWKSTDWLIANCHIQDSILNNSKKPLFDARLHAMTLYRTPESFTHKFQRSEKEAKLYNVESWLSYHGNVLKERFQLSAYKLMNHVLRTIDITKYRGDFLEVASKISANIHIVTINSDLFFKADENWETYVELKSIKDNVSISEIKSIHGHDAFLIEFDQLSSFLSPIFESEKIESEIKLNKEYQE